MSADPAAAWYARLTANLARADAALADLHAATTIPARLEAAKALESAACQLRRALKAAA